MGVGLAKCLGACPEEFCWAAGYVANKVHVRPAPGLGRVTADTPGPGQAAGAAGATGSSSVKLAPVPGPSLRAVSVPFISRAALALE